ncbi:hypothetical protein KQI69_00800 [Eubacterium sp. MSJ-13]|uniref:hypothetical protein n=1 Tax=Eubacterium sp. MSJ-13 TaxID=2841513 RepID=UPI001C0F68AA|nr:hypothetical protein [Eubacterium sp. MSJ-13]MBU5477738.1 hypothetical protein [Eubacterium sp. MSJ-13]
MIKKNIFKKKAVSLLLTASLLTGVAGVTSGCGSKKKNSNEPITLDVYSMLANYSGEQQGWFADLMKEKFNVKLNYIQADDSTFQTRTQNKNLGDIIVFGNDNKEYVQAVKGGLLYDWTEDGLLDDYGPYIKEHMADALDKNKQLTKKITNNKSDAIYGFGHDVASSSGELASFFYTWDVRWDLYKKLGYPEIKDLKDFEQLLVDMHKLEPTDESGNKTYAVSLWSDWDSSMMMAAKSAATAYYGYDELGIGLYDASTGKFHDALEENGPYITMLKFFNNLYQKGLVDPDSMTQTFNEVTEKVAIGKTQFSLFNYTGSLLYNTEKHTKEGKLMYSLKPEDASPAVYALTTKGNDRIWTIGASCEYPEEAMEVINFLCTPEGYLDMQYGPKGECWNYDKNKNTYLTELGEKCHQNKSTKMTGKYKGLYKDGEVQINNTTWSIDAKNPEAANGETFNQQTWKHASKSQISTIEKDWQKKTGSTTLDDYMKKGKYSVIPGSTYSASEKSDEFNTTWSQVGRALTEASWNALYAKTDKEFYKIIDKVKKQVDSYGYAECVKWSQNEAKTRYQLEQSENKTK